MDRRKRSRFLALPSALLLKGGFQQIMEQKEKCRDGTVISITEKLSSVTCAIRGPGSFNLSVLQNHLGSKKVTSGINYNQADWR